jgi:hypothetical protein
MLREAVLGQSATQKYDVFLSHSFQDAQLILGLRDAILEMGFSVYVDWLEDPTLDRSNVTPETAGHLRERMKSSRSLLYATSEAAATSKWMPWETGYFDAHSNGRVAIVPVTDSDSSDDRFRGREYLGLYPYVTAAPPLGSSQDTLWVQWATDNYVNFRAWLSGSEPYRRS